MYASPQTRGETIEDKLKHLFSSGVDGVMIAGDLHARHKAWVKMSNIRRAAVASFVKEKN